jgi:hypothetical protein
MDGVQALRQPYSCGTLATASAAVGEVFTCLSFEHRLGVRPLEARRLYVGSLSGDLAAIAGSRLQAHNLCAQCCIASSWALNKIS